MMSATAQQEKRQAPSEIPPPVTLTLRPVFDVTPDQLLELSSLNSDLRLELTAEGELIVMSPTSWESTRRNAQITFQLTAWAIRDGTGYVADSSGGFTLPNNATRSPDGAWVERSRIDALSTKERNKYATLCPDFLIELRSSSDRLSVAQRKMREWIANGARLAWLLDPDTRRVYVYQHGTPVQQLDNPDSVSGDPVLPGFVLDLREIW